jgi:hypothetical protein
MKRNPFWIGCEWTGVFTSAITIIIIIALTLCLNKGQKRLLPQLRILLQIRRVGFYIKCKYFSNIYDLAFSKFGQLRMGQLSLNLKHFLGLQCYSVRNGDWIVVLEYFRAYLSFS